jgi:hypothetical protein
MRCKNLLQIFGLLLVLLGVQSLVAGKVSAFAGSPTPNNCGVAVGTLCNYDSGAPGPRNSPWDEPVLLHFGSGNPVTVTGGAIIHFTVGYNSLEPSYGNAQHIISWVNISSPGTPASNYLSSVNATGGISSMNNCFDEVASTDSPYYDSNWNQPGHSGTTVCDGQAKPYTNATSPINTLCDPLDGGCSQVTTGSGATALWYNGGDSGLGNQPRYALSLVTKAVASPTQFCIREHVSVTNYNPVTAGTWNNSPGALAALATKALSDYKGTIGDSVNSNNVLCYIVNPPPPPNVDVPPTFSLTADCHIIYMAGLNDANDINEVGVHFYGVIYHENPDGSRGAAAGTINTVGARGSGGVAWDYRDPSQNQVPSEAYTQNDGWWIDVGVNNIKPDGTDGAFGYVQTVKTGRCYTAHCTNLSVDSPLSGTTNGVAAGSTFSVTATFHNDQPTSTTDYLPAVLNDSASNGFTLGATIYHDPPWTSAGGFIHVAETSGNIAAGSDFKVTITGLTAPTGPGGSPTSTPLTAYADYYGLFAIDTTACTTNILSYVPFHVIAHAPDPNLETLVDNPTDAYYRSWVENTSTVTDPSYTVSIPTTTYFQYFKQLTGTTTNVPPIITAGTPALSAPHSYPVGTSHYFFGSAGPGSDLTDQVDFHITHPPPTAAGDQYCMVLTMPYTRGFVGPGGSTDVAGTSAPSPNNNCSIVVNQPFFKAVNGSVSTGSAFNTGTCNGGELAGWNNDLGTNPVSENFGAGTQLAALATGGITGFASNQNLPHAPPNDPPSNLSFANKGVIIGPADQGSTPLGGSYGNTPCLTAQSITPTAALPSTSVNILGNTAPGQYSYSYGTDAVPANLSLSGGYIKPGVNMSILVHGNVYLFNAGLINGIIYEGDNYNALTGFGAGATAVWNTAKNIPSFVIQATGNIYISPRVTELDGIYSAQPGNGGTGTIYTCSDPVNHFTFMVRHNLFTQCNNQLVVYGSFIANKVDLMRASGSLRDETPVGATTPAAPACSNTGTQMVSQTCAAEVFEFSPEIDLSNSAETPPSAGALHYETITGLPPVL